MKDVLEKVFETSTPLMLRAMVDLGCVIRSSSGKAQAKTFDLAALKRVDSPTEGEYMHSSLKLR
eukprot:CAMPEP_0194053818 /NCGR_PEP_ID=MMETSP0009_2-20130614/51360_1 /TAXON_ID=210454 /ORGANISM="Grammatophora oceanica, Strain CCMP 410" /LENGTH=63 /DNA_ID=CAMNT_0038702083 /DNA_START=6 /DNA_END=193 /DNA_ORIENTATION=-